MTKAASQKKPKIIVGDVDHERLTGLAEGALDRIPDIADELLSELDRAKVVKQSAVPASVIRMGSTADIKIGDAEPRRPLRADARGADHQDEGVEQASHFFFSSGKMRSILRQSFCAAAHFAVQSGA